MLELFSEPIHHENAPINKPALFFHVTQSKLRSAWVSLPVFPSIY